MLARKTESDSQLLASRFSWYSISVCTVDCTSDALFQGHSLVASLFCGELNMTSLLHPSLCCTHMSPHSDGCLATTEVRKSSLMPCVETRVDARVSSVHLLLHVLRQRSWYDNAYTSKYDIVVDHGS